MRPLHPVRSQAQSPRSTRRLEATRPAPSGVYRHPSRRGALPSRARRIRPLPCPEPGIGCQNRRSFRSAASVTSAPPPTSGCAPFQQPVRDVRRSNSPAIRISERQIRAEKQKNPVFGFRSSGMVLVKGLEPPLPCGKRILSPPRLPFRHTSALIKNRVPARGASGRRKRSLRQSQRHALSCSYENGGATQIRTGDKAFAELRLTTWLWRPEALVQEAGWKYRWSGRRDSNPRPSPWQGDALPLSHVRM